MIVNVGKRIIVEMQDYRFSRDADKPGAVYVINGNKGAISLPGNEIDAEHFIEAYRRCVAEQIDYRETKVE